jgi:outer membrane receptor for monomeric catechols
LVDFVVTDLLKRTTLHLNQSVNRNHYLRLNLVGTQSERDAIGAKVEVRADDQSWVAWGTAGDGYLCKNESTLHFGLGDETKIDEVTVTWPSQRVERFTKVGVDKVSVLVEGKSESFELK